MRPHEYVKTAINAAAGAFGARVVGAAWGPRGVQKTLERVKARGFSPALVFDVGASNGKWTEECRKIFGAARYVLVDPLEVNREPLQRLAEGEEKISIFYGAAAARSGQLQIHDHGDQSSVLDSADFPGVIRTVQSTTVDSLFESHGSPSPVVLKADVQGYEIEVLKGASGCLQSTELLILEVSFRRLYKDSALANEIIAYVAEHGFRIFDICSYIHRESDGDLLQSDLVFVHESSALFDHHGWK